MSQKRKGGLGWAVAVLLNSTKSLVHTALPACHLVSLALRGVTGSGEGLTL